VADCCCTPVPPSNGSRPKSPRRRGGRWSEGGPSKTDGYGEASITVGMASNPPTRLTRVAVATPDIGGLPRRRWCRRGSHDAPRTLPSLSKRQTPVGRSAPLRRRSRLATWSGAGGSRTASSGSAMHFARQGDREFFDGERDGHGTTMVPHRIEVNAVLESEAVRADLTDRRMIGIWSPLRGTEIGGWVTIKS
jgi:hypothetical protein